MFLLSAMVLGARPIFAEEAIEDTAKYSNPFDESLNFYTMNFLPTWDNVNGIYAKAVDKRLQELIEKNHRWSAGPSIEKGGRLDPEELIGHPKCNLRFCKF